MQNVLDITFSFAHGYSEWVRTLLCNLWTNKVAAEHFLKGNSMLKAAQPKKKKPVKSKGLCHILNFKVTSI